MLGAKEKKIELISHYWIIMVTTNEDYNQDSFYFK
jgi:hypothetical protein